MWDGTHAGEVGEQRDDGEFEEGSHAGSFDMISCNSHPLIKVFYDFYLHFWLILFHF